MSPMIRHPVCGTRPYRRRAETRVIYYIDGHIIILPLVSEIVLKNLMQHCSAISHSSIGATASLVLARVGYLCTVVYIILTLVRYRPISRAILPRSNWGAGDEIERIHFLAFLYRTTIARIPWFYKSAKRGRWPEPGMRLSISFLCSLFVSKNGRIKAWGSPI